MHKTLKLAFAAAALIGAVSAAQAQQKEILNVSYDVARDVFKDYNPRFIAAYKAKTGEELVVKQSHGGSSKQVRAVADGLEADVVTMNQPTDVSFLAEKGLLAADWNKKFPNNASPYTSAMVFIVRKGNPKGFKDWSDLVKPGVTITLPHPKNTGNGRNTYLSAWGWAQRQPGGNEKTAAAFVGAFLKNVPAFAPGGRDATTNFIQRGQGDVLITFESEAELIAREFGRGNFDVVYPTQTLQTEFPVAVVDKVVDKRGTRKQAQAYLEYLWSKDGQENAAQNYLRPTDKDVLKKYAAQFPPIKTFTVEEVFGSWDKAFNAHFKDGGSFDQVYQVK
ncbi:sulfate ABC transporter substrate-binding protein [Uliginosibacterium sp. 31-16]|uniref:sulfate ABC transporter substrate-binding protein n=1 Tax=Uliginosibacterium sp. 31-16 TaxID=3068315 RepID=UPI00273D569E|nr:sulfate ABC transporter substrate-binding protein [Uliginosibacterium sp. 31-16]MDP5241371.1 sulfate ABC transporter substrate-binding protein [Uliginosibacterium sp. 31-16]